MIGSQPATTGTSITTPAHGQGRLLGAERRPALYAAQDYIVRLSLQDADVLPAPPAPAGCRQNAAAVRPTRAPWRPSRRMASTVRLYFSRNWMSANVLPTTRECGREEHFGNADDPDCRSLSWTPTSGWTSRSPEASAQHRLSTRPSTSNTSPRLRKKSLPGPAVGSRPGSPAR
jgi:hypothetical protein